MKENKNKGYQSISYIHIQWLDAHELKCADRKELYFYLHHLAETNPLGTFTLTGPYNTWRALVSKSWAMTTKMADNIEDALFFCQTFQAGTFSL